MKFVCTLILSIFYSLCWSGVNEICQRAKNCRLCMGSAPECAWCFDDNFDDSVEGPGFRCAPRPLLTKRGCPDDKIESVSSKIISVMESSGKPDQSQDSQLSPSSHNVWIRPHDSQAAEIHFQSIREYPVDIYFLVDFSYTMRDDLETVSNLTREISVSFRGVTKDLRLGFGAFVDKPIFPFVVPTKEALANPCVSGVGTSNIQCDPPFLYKHILSLTDNMTEFQEKTIDTRPSGNLDSPEGGLDALMQVAQCGSQIGWREEARKIVLFATDGGFHLAGDGRLAGLIQPPPRTCQLTHAADKFNSSLVYTGWHTADQTDYPSVGQVAEVLTESDISMIFATDEKHYSLYSQLAEFLPSAAVGILTSSSANIVQLLRENYEKITNQVETMVTYDSSALEVTLMTRCHKESVFSKKSICIGHPVGGRIDYKLSVTSKHCFDDIKQVSLKMVALKDQAVIKVRSACHCPACETALVPASRAVSPRCHSHGQLVCGACVCAEGFLGEFCGCSTTTTAEQLLTTCIKPGTSAVCSGRGRCDCGRCRCTLERYHGQYCECDNYGCKRASDDNQVCGGPERGVCLCNGTCACQTGYKDDRCDCLDDDRNCYGSANKSGPICSGNGACDCGQCFCNPGFTGHLCNEIQGGEAALCTDRAVEQCVVCLRAAHTSNVETAESGALKETTKRACEAVCNSTAIDTENVRIVEEANQNDGSSLCIIYTENSCRLIFTYRFSDAIYVKRKLDLSIVRRSECTKTTNILFIVMGVIAGIVFGGLILLLIYKLVITIDDRRELARFKMNNENVHWEMAENPIFEPPTTKVMNPTFDDGL